MIHRSIWNARQVGHSHNLSVQSTHTQRGVTVHRDTLSRNAPSTIIYLCATLLWWTLTTSLPQDRRYFLKALRCTNFQPSAKRGTNHSEVCTDSGMQIAPLHAQNSVCVPLSKRTSNYCNSSKHDAMVHGMRPYVPSSGTVGTQPHSNTLSYNESSDSDSHLRNTTHNTGGLPEPGRPGQLH